MTPRLLTDRFGRPHSYLRISVTDRCNLRCVYCMPAEGIVWKPREEILTYEEILRLARVFVDLGVDKIRLTGGEPTARKDLDFLIKGLAGIESVKTLLMTTNGTTLKEHAGLYKSAGLQGINISLDTLQPHRFEEITRRAALTEVLDGIEAALTVGFSPLKINVVVMKPFNTDEILDFVAFVKDKPLNVRFIEFMPFKGNGWGMDSFYPYAAMKAVIEEHYALIPQNGEPSAVAKDFALAGHQGTVSFVTSMSESFCGTCNRLRLTAEGNIKSCLFDPAEVPVRDLLRAGCSDAELHEKIYEALALKPEGHVPMAVLPSVENRSMIQIGG
jgi:GTP 3',8-cyclase